MSSLPTALTTATAKVEESTEWAEAFIEMGTGTSSDTITMPDATTRPSIRKSVQDALVTAALWKPPIAYAAALSVTDELQIYEEAGVYYAPLRAELPFTTSDPEDWATDSAKFSVVFAGDKRAYSFATVTEAESVNGAALVPASVDAIYLRGNATDGVGGAHYKRAGSEPSHAGKFQDAGGQWWELNEFAASPAMFGALGDDTTDDSAALAAVIAYAADKINSSSNLCVEVRGAPGAAYLFATSLTFPPRVAFNANGATFRYSGTGVAVTLGDNAGVLSYGCRFENFRLLLSDKASTGVTLYGATLARVSGYIEGSATPFDNTRTNRGVVIDGANVSAFNNFINVTCNHIHECFRICTTGTVQPTAQTFFDCYAFGDQATDNGSIGFNFVDTAISGFADGTKIIGGNIEACNIGIYFGQNCRAVDVNTRFEINAVSTSRVLKYHSTTEGISVVAAGLNLANIGAISAGIENFDGGTGHSLKDRYGNIRVCGGGGSWSGFSAPIHENGALINLYKASSNVAHYMYDDATGTGRMLHQAGRGSASFGAYMALHGHAHSTSPGVLAIGGSSGKSTIITNGFGGSTLWKADTTGWLPGADNTYAVGNGLLRPSVIYAASGTINTSDKKQKRKRREEKQEIKALSEAVASVPIHSYQWLDSIDAKGDDARVHIGVYAQDVEEAIKAAGLDPGRYGLWCADPLFEEKPVLGDDGVEVVNDGVPVTETAPVLDDDGEQVIRYGVRYDQIIGLILTALKDADDKKTKQIADLKTQVRKLERRLPE